MKLASTIFVLITLRFMITCKGKGSKICRPPPQIIIENLVKLQDGNHSIYYKSVNSANWNPAGQDCHNIFGQGSTLLSIETEEELHEVQTFLEKSDDSSTTFWINGRYDIDSGLWKWKNANTSFGPWIVWNNDAEKVGYFPTLVSAPYLIYHGIGSGAPLFDYDFNSANYRYICEIPRKITQEWCKSRDVTHL